MWRCIPIPSPFCACRPMDAKTGQWMPLLVEPASCWTKGEHSRPPVAPLRYDVHILLYQQRESLTDECQTGGLGVTSCCGLGKDMQLLQPRWLMCAQHLCTAQVF